MRNRRKFGSNIPLPVEGLELELNDQVFKVRGEMSGARLLKVVADMDGDNEAASARAMLEFLESSFLLEDRERGMDYLYNSDPPIGFDTLQEIIEWLIESYTKKSYRTVATVISWADSEHWSYYYGAALRDGIDLLGPTCRADQFIAVLISYITDNAMKTKEEAQQFEKIHKIIHGTNLPEMDQGPGVPPEHNAPVYSPEEFRAQRDFGIPDGIKEMPVG
ncbi:tail assembly chaperone [Gordonia phage Phendrix]|uniref:Tail assembly chaperone n=1 Tax=Gordonia phage Phendrix TaxID=2593335 RepID=A0A514U107_9CAUD|nr:tail assembly chaperone [Gordonia phage Phendrix]QDK02632.1 tail assembly chaperone [Gordonia phage Phendrix]